MAAPTKKKEIKSTIKLQIPAGKATPAPPLGPVLGQNGVSIPEFCTQFNDLTRERIGDTLPVVLTVFKDGSFKMQIKQPTVASMIKKAAGQEKGSANPKKDKVGKITLAQAKEIATLKMSDLNTNKIESAINIVKGSARSLGIEVQ